MKNSFSLVEVLVSVILISIVIGSMLSLNSQNAHTISTLKESSIQSSSLGIVTLLASKASSDKKYYLSDLVNFDVDDIDKVLKDISFEFKNEELEETSLYDNTPYTIKIFPNELTIFNDTYKKKLVLIKLEI